MPDQIPVPVPPAQPNVVLIGPMASGKSSVGAALARRLSRPHVDSDQFFVARHGSVAAFFTAHGEEAFRRAEETIVAELLASPRPSVISLGGGSVLSEATRERLRRHFVVMLDVTEEQALARIGDAVTRPLLKGNPAAVWKGIYEEREHLYRQCADLVIDASHHSVEARVDTIEKELPSREELRS